MRGDERAASEIVGYILVFGIIALLLVLGMMAFRKAQSDAEVRAVQLRAQSVGTRVAGLVVQASLLAERQCAGAASPCSTIQVRYLALLPDQLEGKSYTVYLEPAAAGHAEQVRVWVPATGTQVTSPIFSADAPPTFAVCATSTGGGHLNVRFDILNSQACLFVEAAA